MQHINNIKNVAHVFGRYSDIPGFGFVGMLFSGEELSGMSLPAEQITLITWLRKYLQYLYLYINSYSVFIIVDRTHRKRKKKPLYTVYFWDYDLVAMETSLCYQVRALPPCTARWTRPCSSLRQITRRSVQAVMSRWETRTTTCCSLLFSRVCWTQGQKAIR